MDNLGLQSLKQKKKNCTISQGFLMFMYMNIIYENQEHKLCVWRLKSYTVDDSKEWQLVSEISPDRFKIDDFNYLPLAIDPFDANTMYLWSDLHECFASTNLHKGELVLHNNLERSSSNSRTLSFAQGLTNSYFSIFVLLNWVHSIPSSSQ